MNKINRSAIVPYSQEQMFVLVADIASYPAFLPWCSKTEIISTDENQTTAKLYIAFKGVKQSFTTRNTNSPPDRIDIQLVDGPFRHLVGRWHFLELADSACKIELMLEFSFASKILEKLVGPVFGMIGNTMVDSFHKRARTLYG